MTGELAGVKVMVFVPVHPDNTPVTVSVNGEEVVAFTILLVALSTALAGDQVYVSAPVAVNLVLKFGQITGFPVI